MGRQVTEHTPFFQNEKPSWLLSTQLPYYTKHHSHRVQAKTMEGGPDDRQRCVPNPIRYLTFSHKMIPTKTYATKVRFRGGMAGSENPYPSTLSLIMSQISRCTCKSPAEAAFSVDLAVRTHRQRQKHSNTRSRNARYYVCLTNELADWSGERSKTEEGRHF